MRLKAEAYFQLAAAAQRQSTRLDYQKTAAAILQRALKTARSQGAESLVQRVSQDFVEAGINLDG